MRIWNSQDNLLPVETYPYPPPDRQHVTLAIDGMATRLKPQCRVGIEHIYCRIGFRSYYPRTP